MSVAVEHRPAMGRGDPAIPCERCGSPLAGDQEWCLECGAARTLVHRPGDWRIAAAIVGTVVILALAGFAIALINLSSESNRSAAASAARSAARTTTTSAPTLAAWSIGLPGWTVVLFSSTSQASAQATARHLSAAGLHVGVLNSSEHPGSDLKPGQWVVFAGRYPSRAAARSLASVLQGKGYRARARLVGLPS